MTDAGMSMLGRLGFQSGERMPLNNGPNPHGPGHGPFSIMHWVMSMATPAEVIQVAGRMGVKGVVRVRCRLIEGRDAGKTLIRNVSGPIKIGDIILLKETEMESVGRFNERR